MQEFAICNSKEGMGKSRIESSGSVAIVKVDSFKKKWKGKSRVTIPSYGCKVELKVEPKSCL